MAAGPVRAHTGAVLRAISENPEPDPSPPDGARGDGAAQRTRVRVVVVDDHALVREGTVQLLEQQADLQVTGQAGSGEEALSLLAALDPDVALVDVNLPGMSGLELARQVAARGLRCRVLVVSAYDDAAFVSEALELGVSGYLLKSASARELVNAVRAVADGMVVFDAGVISAHLGRRPRSDPHRPSAALSTRETEVLDLLARGRSNKEIAAELALRVRTVESHVSSVLHKLGVASRTEAVAYALGRHLVSRS